MSNHKWLGNSERDAKGAASDKAGAALDAWVVAMLTCPVDRGTVKLVGIELICERCGRHYPVRGGIPVMLPDESSIEQQF